MKKWHDINSIKPAHNDMCLIKYRSNGEYIFDLVRYDHSFLTPCFYDLEGLSKEISDVQYWFRVEDINDMLMGKS